jgi:hypothetical protein
VETVEVHTTQRSEREREREREKEKEKEKERRECVLESDDCSAVQCAIERWGDTERHTDKETETETLTCWTRMLPCELGPEESSHSSG